MEINEPPLATMIVLRLLTWVSGRGIDAVSEMSAAVNCGLLQEAVMVYVAERGMRITAE